MIGRRWQAWFDEGNLRVRRRRILPWPKVETASIPLGSIVEVGSLSPTDQAKRRAQITVHSGPGPQRVGVYQVTFTPDAWQQVGKHLRGPVPTPDVGLLPGPAGSTAPRTGPPTAAAPRAPLPAPAPVRSVRAVMRAGDPKTHVWLWTHNGTVHASLDPVGDASLHRLDSAEVARLLLADPAKTMPAIRALTGVDDDRGALARMRSWQRPTRTVVTLSASDLAGRRPPEAPRRPARTNPDGTVRTLSGGLPSLGKRRK